MSDATTDLAPTPHPLEDRPAPEILPGPPPTRARTESLLAAFLSGKSPDTLRTYATCLRAFAAWSGASSIPDAAAALLALSPGEANARVLDYRNHLHAAGRAPASIALHLTALRSLVSLARLQGLTSTHIEVPAFPVVKFRDTSGPGAAGVAALLEETRAPESAAEHRDRAIVRLFTDLLLRVGEIASLDLSHVDLVSEPAVVWVKRKRRSEHERKRMTLPPETRAALVAWVAYRGAVAGPLFTSFDIRGAATARRITTRSLNRIVHRLSAAAGHETHPHGLRHAGITRALDQGMAPRDVQKLSGHADINTLFVYDDNRADLAGDVARKLAASW